MLSVQGMLRPETSAAEMRMAATAEFDCPHFGLDIKTTEKVSVFAGCEKGTGYLVKGTNCGNFPSTIDAAVLRDLEMAPMDAKTSTLVEAITGERNPAAKARVTAQLIAAWVAGGDNHVTLLTVGYLTLLGRLWSDAFGAVRSAENGVPAAFARIERDADRLRCWSERDRPVVYAGSEPGHVAFWARACGEGLPFGGLKSHAGRVYASPWGSTDIEVLHGALILSETGPSGGDLTASEMYEAIEEYVRLNGLVDQAERALVIACRLPWLVRNLVGFRLPRPRHTTDLVYGLRLVRQGQTTVPKVLLLPATMTVASLLLEGSLLETGLEAWYASKLDMKTAALNAKAAGRLLRLKWERALPNLTEMVDDAHLGEVASIASFTGSGSFHISGSQDWTGPGQFRAHWPFHFLPPVPGTSPAHTFDAQGPGVRAVGGTMLGVSAAWVAKRRVLQLDTTKQMRRPWSDFPFRPTGVVPYEQLTNREVEAARTGGQIGGLRLRRIAVGAYRLPGLLRDLFAQLPYFPSGVGLPPGGSFRDECQVIDMPEDPDPEADGDRTWREQTVVTQTEGSETGGEREQDDKTESRHLPTWAREEADFAEWTEHDVPGDGECGFAALAGALLHAGVGPSPSRLKDLAREAGWRAGTWLNEVQLAHVADELGVHVTVDHTSHGPIGHGIGPPVVLRCHEDEHYTWLSLEQRGLEEDRSGGHVEVDGLGSGGGALGPPQPGSFAESLMLGPAAEEARQASDQPDAGGSERHAADPPADRLKISYEQVAPTGGRSLAGASPSKRVQFRGGGAAKRTPDERAWANQLSRQLVASGVPKAWLPRALRSNDPPDQTAKCVGRLLRGRYFRLLPAEWDLVFASDTPTLRRIELAGTNRAGRAFVTVVRLLGTPGVPVSQVEFKADAGGCGCKVSPSDATPYVERGAVPPETIRHGLYPEARTGLARFRASKLVPGFARAAKKNGWPAVWRRLANQTNLPGETALGLAAWLASTKSPARGTDEAMAAWICPEHYPEAAKSWHTTLLATGIFFGTRVPVAAFGYLHNLGPKATGEVDWDEEWNKRGQAHQGRWQLPLGPQASEEAIRGRLRDLFARVPGPQQVDDVSEWWARRFDWVVSGAAGRRGTPALSKSLGLGGRANKRTVLARQLAQPPHDGSCAKQARQHAVGHTKKNEPGGKLRAIYGVELDHYLATAFVCEGFEKRVLASISEVGLKPEASERRLLELTQFAKQGGWICSFDYSDFNAQHTVETLRAFQLERAAWWRRQPGPGCAQRAEVGEMLAEQELTTTIERPDTHEVMTVRKGLLSGRRDTSLINTVLNRVYADMITDEAEAALGARPTYFACNGDDTILGFWSYEDARRWRETALRLGFEASRLKSFIHKAEGEFLRKWYTSEGPRGSVARAIGNMVCGNWDRTGGDAARAGLLDETAAQIAELVERGVPAEVGLRLGADLVNYVSGTSYRARDLFEGRLALPGWGEVGRALRTAKASQRLIETNVALEAAAPGLLKEGPGLQDALALVKDTALRAAPEWSQTFAGQALAAALARSELGITQATEAEAEDARYRLARLKEPGPYCSAWDWDPVRTTLQKWGSTLAAGRVSSDVLGKTCAAAGVLRDVGVVLLR